MKNVPGHRAACSATIALAGIALAALGKPPLQAQAAAEVGHVRVPENRKNPGGRSIDLAYVRLRATGSGHGAPLVFLSGGPGASGIEASRGPGAPLFQALRETGDVIAFDQRGTGISQADTGCARTWDFPLDSPGDPARLLPIARARLAECAQDVRARGVDLAGYNAAESAEDLEALREALGVRQIRLWAVSYGTHLALAAIRRHPSSIERAVLAAVEGPDDAMMRSPAALDAQIGRLAEHLKSDPGTRQAFPDLRGQISSLLATLERKPVSVTVEDGKTSARREVTIGAADLAFFARPRLTQSWGIRALPEFFGPMAGGDWMPLAGAALEYRRSAVGPMMAWATICSSGVTPVKLREIEREAKSALLGPAVNFPFPDACAGLGFAPLDSEFRAPVRSAVPVLFVSGSLDGEAPASRTAEIARGFPKATHLVIPGASHGYDLFYFRPEVKAAMLDFLAPRPGPGP